MINEIEVQRKKELLDTHNRYLHQLELQKAVYGVAVGPHVLLQIEEKEREIGKLEAELDRLLGKTIAPQISNLTVEGNLCKRLSENQWLILQQAAIQSAIAGGMAAMGFYQGAWQFPIVLTEGQKNPSTLADIQATLRILQTVHPLLTPVMRTFDCGLSYLGEETKYRDQLQSSLANDIYDGIRDPNEFFMGKKYGFRVIFDGIDGTGSFTRGIPLFCSAVAILVDDQVRASAIYDPVHHVIYSALLSGSYEEPEVKSEAWAWQVATGNRLNLVDLGRIEDNKKLNQEAIGIHLTRSNDSKLEEFLAPHKKLKNSMLERLAKASGGIYAMGSGIVAMSDIARGALGGFVNNITNLWDIAAGEVLVRACGGVVKTFEDLPITYSSPNQTSVIAAKGHLYKEIRASLLGISEVPVQQKRGKS